jgi:hypothetical protein
MLGEAGTIDALVARLEGLARTLPRGDGVRWFNRLYLEATKAVREHVRAARLHAPPFLERLAVVSADHYLRALDAAEGGGDLARAWAPLFDARREGRIAPVQFGLAGMNAHVNHDLPIGVVATCEELGVEPRSGGPEQRDYDSVNAVIRETEDSVKRWLLTGALQELDEAVGPADDVVAIWSITRAREAAWVGAQVLWEMRGHPELTAAHLAVVDRAVGLTSRGMLLPLGV